MVTDAMVKAGAKALKDADYAAGNLALTYEKWCEGLARAVLVAALRAAPVPKAYAGNITDEELAELMKRPRYIEFIRDDGWKPIETAPKDGTVIDVWLGDAKQADIDFYCPDGSRRSTDWRWQSGKFRPVMGLSIAVTLVQPTHWRRIPAPPRPAGEGET